MKLFSVVVGLETVQRREDCPTIDIPSNMMAPLQYDTNTSMLLYFFDLDSAPRRLHSPPVPLKNRKVGREHRFMTLSKTSPLHNDPRAIVRKLVISYIPKTKPIVFRLGDPQLRNRLREIKRDIAMKEATVLAALSGLRIF